MRTGVVLAILGMCALAGPGKVGGNELLRLRTSPLVAQAPAFVKVQTQVDASDDLRWLEVSASSADFSLVSSVELEGRAAPKVKVFSFPNLPAGRYEISAVLTGPGGVLATATQDVEIVGVRGSRR
jgi:hypothetical protein